MKNVDLYLREGLQWIQQHQERFWAIVGASVLSILFIGLIVYHRQTENDQAWVQLGAVQSQLMEGKLGESRKNLETWEGRFSGSDAWTYARFMKADLLYKTSDYVQASHVYGDLVVNGQPERVRPLALSAQASCEEMAGHIPEALALVQKFLDQYPDHFLAAPRYIAHARLLELSGDKAGAAAVYSRFILLYPQSPWTSLAQERNRLLGGGTPAPPPAPALATH